MSKEDLLRKVQDDLAPKQDEWDPEEWDREHWERWMDTIRAYQKDPESQGSVGGTPCEGGVFSSATYGGGAEFYSITGMYENPLLEKKKLRMKNGK
jgi:hypothetical protein